MSVRRRARPGAARPAARALPALIATELNAQLEGFSADELALLTDLLRRFIANAPGAADAACAEPPPDQR